MDQNTLFKRFGRPYKAGTVLFLEGDLGHEMYVIHSGRVEISREIQSRKTVLAILPPGEFLGEMSILNDKPRSATATVLEDAQLLLIDSKTFKQMLHSSTEIAMRMIQKLAQRLEMANSQLEILLVRDANHRVVFALRRMAELYGQPRGIGVLVPTNLNELSGRAALSEEEVTVILRRLQKARLVKVTREGYLIPEVGKLHDYLEFLDMGQKYGKPHQ